MYPATLTTPELAQRTQPSSPTDITSLESIYGVIVKAENVEQQCTSLTALPHARGILGTQDHRPPTVSELHNVLRDFLWGCEQLKEADDQNVRDPEHTASFKLLLALVRLPDIHSCTGTLP
mmetsp:Transcript_11963/g.32857  ORF Transcript_11963/g.32857 Transcript_11963/m.32857 type:complete len:121 (+) Transcript_11963:713-1075(+)